MLAYSKKENQCLGEWQIANFTYRPFFLLRRAGICSVDIEHIQHIDLVFLLLAFNILHLQAELDGSTGNVLHRVYASSNLNAFLQENSRSITAWKVSKYGVISGPYFPAFGLSTERYSVSGIQSECGNTRNNSVFGHVRHVSITWALPLVRLIQLKFLLCRGFCYVNRLRLFILILSYCCTLKL